MVERSLSRNLITDSLYTESFLIHLDSCLQGRDLYLVKDCKACCVSEYHDESVSTVFDKQSSLIAWSWP